MQVNFEKYCVCICSCVRVCVSVYCYVMLCNNGTDIICYCYCLFCTHMHTQVNFEKIVCVRVYTHNFFKIHLHTSLTEN